MQATTETTPTGPERVRERVEASLRSADSQQHLCSPVDGVVVLYDSGKVASISGRDLVKSWSPLLVLPLGLLAFHGDWQFAVLLAVSAVVAAHVVALLMRKGVLMRAAYATPDEVGCRMWYGAWRRLPRSAVARAAWARVDPTTVTPQPLMDYLLLVDDRGRCLLRANVSGIPVEDVGRFVDTLCVALEVVDDLRTLKYSQLRRRFPGSVNWYVARPWLGAILLLVLMLVVAFGVLMVLAALGSLG